MTARVINKTILGEKCDATAITHVDPASLPEPTPTVNDTLPLRLADFDTLSQALDYAAQGQTGINFYNAKGQIEYVLPYSDLKDQAINLAGKLIGMGLNREDRIGIVAHMGPDFVRLFFACQYAGLMAVPLPALSNLGGRQGYEDQLRRILDKSGAVMALGPEDVMASLQSAAQDLNLKFIGTAQEIETSNAVEINLQPLQKDDLCHIQFSSGSTRHPLGVVISQKALMANASSVGQHGLCVRTGDRVASWLPFYHDMGLIGFMIIPIATQMSIDYIYTDGFARRPLSWLDIISRNKCTLAFSPTFGYEICTRRAARQSGIKLDLSSWRAAGIGGEMVQPDVMRNFTEAFEKYGFRGEAFVPSYGLAEATLAFSFTPLDTGVLTDHVDRDLLVENHIAKQVDPNDASCSVREFALCGVPLPGYKLEIRGEDDDVLGDRLIGSVYIQAPSLMDSYDKDEGATQAVLDKENGWLNTGDMGYTIDSHVVITGRAKDLIIVNGRNVWPQDLEWHVENEVDHIKPRDTAAFSIRSDDKTEQAVILIQCRTHDKDTQDQIIQNAKAVIFRNAGIACDIVLIPAGSLPFTTSGKLSRNLSRKNYEKGIIQPIRENQ